MGNTHSYSGHIKPVSTRIESKTVPTVSTRSSPPPTTMVVEELGIVTSHATGDAFVSSLNAEMLEQERLKRLAVDNLCNECSLLGGNSVLAMQLQVIAASNGGYRAKAHATGTCVRLEAEGGKYR